ncbi:MAG TPA: AAA family ATPase [Planctomycetes bacterium]|nr:AAA family ATPase [Planctomycetota bacterium]
MNSEEREGVARALLEAEELLLGKSREILRQLEPKSLEGDVLLFEARRSSVRGVGPKLLRVLTEKVSEVLGTPLQVRIHPKEQRKVEKRLYLDAANQTVHLLLRGLVQDPKPPVEGMNPIVIHGPAGVGKTFFLRRFLDALERPVAFWNAEDLIRQIIRRAHKGGLKPFCRALVESRILIIDEVHRFRNKQRCQVELARILDEMRSLGNLVLLASRHHPMKIYEFRESLASRFLGGFVVALSPPLKETLWKVLEDHGIRGARAESFLEGLGREPSMGRLLEAIARSKGSAEGSSPSEENGGGLWRPFEMGGWDLERLRDRVLREFQVSLQEFQGRRRPRHVSTARQVVAYLYTKGGISCSETARHLGWFSVSSVVHAVRRVEERMQRDDDFRRSVEGCIHG